jgi:hypothetical protein
VYSTVLPSCKPNHSVAAAPLALLKNVQWREHTDNEEIELRQELLVVGLFAGQHDFIDNQVIALSCQLSDCAAHAPHQPLSCGPGLYGDTRFAIF